MPLDSHGQSCADIAVGLGSNIGDREHNIRRACAAFGALDGISVIAVAPLYETKPWGKTDQPTFLNTCLKAETSLSPEDVLAACLATEHEMGRERLEKWGPRVIDLDLLVYGDQKVDQPGLTVPHPHIADRAFVALPLADIWPDAVVQDKTARDLAAAYEGSDDIWRFEPSGITAAR